jgi:hypothetical protein
MKRLGLGLKRIEGAQLIFAMDSEQDSSLRLKRTFTSQGFGSMGHMGVPELSIWK